MGLIRCIEYIGYKRHIWFAGYVGCIGQTGQTRSVGCVESRAQAACAVHICGGVHGAGYSTQDLCESVEELQVTKGNKV